MLACYVFNYICVCWSSHKRAANATITPQVLYPVVRGLTQHQDRLQGDFIASVIQCFHHTTDGLIHGFRH